MDEAFIKSLNLDNETLVMEFLKETEAEGINPSSVDQLIKRAREQQVGSGFLPVTAERQAELQAAELHQPADLTPALEAIEELKKSLSGTLTELSNDVSGLQKNMSALQQSVAALPAKLGSTLAKAASGSTPPTSSPPTTGSGSGSGTGSGSGSGSGTGTDGASGGTG